MTSRCGKMCHLREGGGEAEGGNTCQNVLSSLPLPSLFTLLCIFQCLSLKLFPSALPISLFLIHPTYPSVYISLPSAFSLYSSILLSETIFTPRRNSLFLHQIYWSVSGLPRKQLASGQMNGALRYFPFPCTPSPSLPLPPPLLAHPLPPSLSLPGRAGGRAGAGRFSCDSGRRRAPKLSDTREVCAGDFPLPLSISLCPFFLPNCALFGLSFPPSTLL